MRARLADVAAMELHGELHGVERIAIAAVLMGASREDARASHAVNTRRTRGS
jgi:hypothetical protein